MSTETKTSTDSHVDHRMTIKQATGIFTEDTEMRTDYRALCKAVIDAGDSICLPNSNFLHALQYTSVMFRNTRQRLLMLCGSTADKFLEILSVDFIGSLEVLRDRGHFARLVIVNHEGPLTFLDPVKAKFGNTLQIARGRISDETMLEHFIVADDAVRDEEAHAKLTDGSPASAIHASIYFNDPARAGIFTERFNAVFNRLFVAGQTPA